ncbi:MAG: hypothetical protein K0S45_3775 [Nitrospira sp.]|jgi:hypothetical protein|nr:hypothetical protein [Nitrospira sp.]
MTCMRCGGLMIENWWGGIGSVKQRKLQGTRCVNCGCIDDPVIRANKRHSHPIRMSVPRGTVHRTTVPAAGKIEANSSIDWRKQTATQSCLQSMGTARLGGALPQGLQAKSGRS